MNNAISLGSSHKRNPWYKQPWPWILIALPSIVVLACIATILIAMHEPDGLVVTDYYKSGLAINKKLSKDLTAKKLDLNAKGKYDKTSGLIVLNLSGRVDSSTRQLIFNLAHPTRSKKDIKILLDKNAVGEFSGSLQAQEPVGFRYGILEPSDRSWRLVGRFSLQQNEWELSPERALVQETQTPE